MNRGAERAVRTVVLAVMSVGSHGGVADQMTNLALRLPDYGVRPIVLIRNPLVANHAYATLLHQHGVEIWAVTDQQYRVVYRGFRLLLGFAFPLILLDALLRHKTIDASRQSVWGVLRRLGYVGLDFIFWLRLAIARFTRHAQVAHFRNPDGWQKIIWAKRLGYCTVYTEDTVPRSHTQPLYEGLARAMPALDAVTAVSKASAESVRAYCKPDTSLHGIANLVEDPVSFGLSNGRQPDEFVVGCIARLVPEKDVDTLLRAAEIFCKERIELKVMIYGDGPLRGSLEATARSLGLDGKVVFAGAFAKTDLPEVMASIDLVVLASIYEGFGVTLVEGMAFGKPAVATAGGGVPEVVVDGVTGLLVPPESPQALADAIVRLASDGDLYNRFAHAARERYLNCYTPETVVPQYVAIYEQAMASHDLNGQQTWPSKGGCI
jgi:glycosyltransferase involved in cell wall biosynthesis